MKCIVKDCQNQGHQGEFIGILCSPCHKYITKGEGKYSQAYRNAQRTWAGLTRQEFREATDGLEDLEDCWIALEAKLRSKNI